VDFTHQMEDKDNILPIKQAFYRKLFQKTFCGNILQAQIFNRF
jgi:hypothetical protein